MGERHDPGSEGAPPCRPRRTGFLETETPSRGLRPPERIELLGEQAHPHDANRRLVTHLTSEADALFTFLGESTIDATSWRGEQAVRPTVVNRKVWEGNRTWRRAATQGRIMSAIRTAVQQGIDPIEFFVHLARAPDPGAVSLFD